MAEPPGASFGRGGRQNCQNQKTNDTMKPEARIQRVVHSQLSWRLCNREVEAYVTELGGHLGPVTFQLKGKPAQPFSLAPWADEPVDPALPPLLQVLRGDFFCLPFGGNAAPYRGEQHPPHGETANGKWSFESFETQGGRTSLSLRLRTMARAGRVDKTIALVEGHTAVYCRHTVSGMAGAMNFGHHPMLKFPETPGSGVITTSPFVHGQVFPGPFELPENCGYSFLKPGAEFDNLERVPALTGGVADLSRYPARRGFEDLVLLISDTRVPFAWTAVTFPKQRQVWFSLKDPRLLRATIFWISNGGRYYRPWNGRHHNVMGLEDVTSFFHLGLAESARKNLLSQKGYPTVMQLSAQKPLVVPYIMGMAALPAGFDRVASIAAGAEKDTLVMTARNGKRALTKIALDFLRPAVEGAA